METQTTEQMGVFAVTFVYDHMVVRTVVHAPLEEPGDGWDYDGDTWSHCDRPAWTDDHEVTCSKCQGSWSWDDNETAVRYACELIRGQYGFDPEERASDVLVEMEATL